MESDTQQDLATQNSGCHLGYGLNSKNLVKQIKNIKNADEKRGILQRLSTIWVMGNAKGDIVH